MHERLIRLAGRLYPASWRRRYGVEFEALLEDADWHWQDVLDVLLGALRMRMTTWTFAKIAAGFGVAGALLCGGMSIIALPDQFVSSTILHVNTMMEEPSIDFTGKLAVGLIQDTLSRDLLASVIERQGLYERERSRKGMDNAIERMRRDISFDRIGSSNEFHVAFRYGDAKQAQRTERELINKLMAGAVAFSRGRGSCCPQIAALRQLPFNLQVLEPASLPERPSSPNRLLIAAMGLAGGLLLGTLTAVVARTRPATDPAGNSPKSS
jgi:hypothetical protein